MLYDGEVPVFGTYRGHRRSGTGQPDAGDPLREVAYEQIAADVTPGTANSIATDTLGYK